METDGTRRAFLKSLAAASLALNERSESNGAFAWRPARVSGQSAPQPVRPPRIRFAAIGLNHSHITGQVEAVMRGGGQLVSFFAKEPDLAAAFATRFPSARLARSEREILEDTTIQLIVSASIPNERAPLGVQAMRHGKDFMVDKPAATSLEQLDQLRRVQAETKRMYSVLIERHESKVITRAGDLVRAGAIGQVVQTVGLAPHRMTPQSRPAWFFERERYGGILCDLASHNIDAFLFFTGSTRADVVASQVGNVHHPQYPELEDFGDMTLRGNRGAGYIRADWFTPGGISPFGDGRLTILGTDGYMELRKNVDLAGRTGANHLFVVDQKETRYVDCGHVSLPYAERLVDDVLNRTETSTPQAHTFLAMELALKAEKNAQRIERQTPPSPRA
jgi:predicted dehydrogenase